jgi:hypothetical protein
MQGGDHEHEAEHVSTCIGAGAARASTCTAWGSRVGHGAGPWGRAYVGGRARRM